MKLNTTFTVNIKEIYGKRGEVWLENLQEHLAHLCEKHHLVLISAMPNLSYHFVGLVKILATNETAVIKMSLENQYLENEVRCLQCFTAGVPKVYWFDVDEHAVLMEHLKPGYSLKELIKEGQDDLATQIICQEIKNLQSNQKPTYQFKHVSKLADSLSVLDQHVDSYLLSKAKSLFHDLTFDQSKDVILHGDLHHDNILASEQSWKAIDPHGYIGDPAFEVGSIIFNPYDCFPSHQPLLEIIKRRLKIMVRELPFAAQRIKAWAFCKTMLSVAWTYEDHGKIDEGELEIARIVDSMKL